MFSSNKVAIGLKMLYFGKVVVFGQKWLYYGKNGCIFAKLFYSAKVVVIGEKRLYSGKNDCIRAKVALFRQKMLFLGKVVVFGQKWF